ncbi:MAG TPA: NAD(+)/NADH kinase [Gemmatimonadaceae bacterium]|nr:NAD(+)/NADH kinase [Gemmatimonadaceae bacterium]
MDLALVVNARKKSSPRVLQELRASVAGTTHRMLLWASSAQELEKRSDCGMAMRGYEVVDDIHAGDVVLALGGDGTLLTAVRLLGDDLRPLLGINLGSLGFLTDTPEDRAAEALARVLGGDYRLDPRMLLEVEHRAPGTNGMRARALNDVVLHGPSARVVEVGLRAAGVDLGSTLADGMVVATPSGSTAYSLSAGGPIVSPRLRALIVTPISAHTLSMRPLVVGADEEVEIELRRLSAAHADISVDGHLCWPLPAGDSIRVRAAPRDLQLVVTQEQGFYRTLRSKLGWGQGRPAPPP